MRTPTTETFLICDDATDTAPTIPLGRPTAATAPAPSGGGTDLDAPEPPFDPGRWIMRGWRSGSWKAGPALTHEQHAAVINTPRGPCARCATLHHRYGPGGQPLCPACRAALH